MKTILLLLSMLLLVGCDDTTDASLLWEGDGGTPAPFTIGSLTPEVTIIMNSEPQQATFVVDTGSPLNLADVGFYGESAGLYTRDVHALGLRFPELPMIYEDWIADTAPIHGILGTGILTAFDWELNYPELTITLHPDGFPQLYPEDLPVSFMLSGGGRYRVSNGDIYDVGPTRHLVWLEIEGTRVLGLLDTGASYMVARQSFMDLLGMEGRPDLGTQQMITISGPIEAPLTELATVAFEDATAHSMLPDILTTIMPDSFFTDLYLETGKLVEVLIGGTYLSNFRLRFAEHDRIIHVSPPTGLKRAISTTGHSRLPIMLQSTP